MLKWLYDVSSNFIKLTEHTDRKEIIKATIQLVLETISESTFPSLFNALKISLRNFKLLTYYDNMKRKAANFDLLP